MEKYMQGYLDEQFIELEELQDDANPNFVEEVATLYFKDSARLISNIEQALRVTLIFIFIFSIFEQDFEFSNVHKLLLTMQGKRII